MGLSKAMTFIVLPHQCCSHLTLATETQVSPSPNTLQWNYHINQPTSRGMSCFTSNCDDKLQQISDICLKKKFKFLHVSLDSHSTQLNVYLTLSTCSNPYLFTILLWAHIQSHTYMHVTVSQIWRIELSSVLSSVLYSLNSVDSAGQGHARNQKYQSATTFLSFSFIQQQLYPC